MKTNKSILFGAVLIAVPFVSQADDSYVDVYQFGTGSYGEIKQTSSSSTNSIGFAYDIYANKSFSTEQADMAMLQESKTSVEVAKPSVPGYIGAY